MPERIPEDGRRQVRLGARSPRRRRPARGDLGPRSGATFSAAALKALRDSNALRRILAHEHLTNMQISRLYACEKRGRRLRRTARRIRELDAEDLCVGLGEARICDTLAGSRSAREKRAELIELRTNQAEPDDELNATRGSGSRLDVEATNPRESARPSGTAAAHARRQLTCAGAVVESCSPRPTRGKCCRGGDRCDQ